MNDLVMVAMINNKSKTWFIKQITNHVIHAIVGAIFYHLTGNSLALITWACGAEAGQNLIKCELKGLSKWDIIDSGVDLLSWNFILILGAVV